jgi:hypothetical protein
MAKSERRYVNRSIDRGRGKTIVTRRDTVLARRDDAWRAPTATAPIAGGAGQW